MDSTQPDDGNNPDVKTILILAANPESTSRLHLDQEVREIDEGLRRGKWRSQFKLEQKWAVRQRDFYRAILDYQPQIVHFSGHGAGVDGIVLENEADEPAFLNASALSSMFELFATKGVECVLLNACYSEVQAKAISQHVNYVIGMNRTIGDKAARAFSVAFYDAIAAGQQMEFAYKLGRSVLMNYLEEQTPVLLKKPQIGVEEPLFDIVPPNPYVGLAAFTEVDAAFFFGRETFVNGLVEAVNQQPLVGVIGPSGSGKSSVVLAGLFPQLRITGNWLIESFRPGDQPFYQLASVLVRLLEPSAGETAQLRVAVGLAADMEVGTITLSTVISRLNERDSSKRLLLFADQFEELYTLCQNKEVIERFVDALLAAVNLDNFTLVFTLRADFYSFVLGYRPFRDALEQFTPKLLSSMNRSELLRAIEQPALKMVVSIDAKLTERILDDVGNEPGNLPLLEFALTRLWEKQQKRLLTHQAYDEIGGVTKALANHAEQVYQQLNSLEQKVVPRIFVQLVRPGEGTEDTRRIATRAEIGEKNWGLVSYLAGYPARLVVTGRDEKSGEDTVEVVHEALIREWLTLREWMKKDRSFRAWQERLRATIHQWLDTKRDEGALLRGVSLIEAEEKLKERREELSSREQDFIQQSVELRDRLERKEKVRKQREIAGFSAAVLVIITTLGLTAWNRLEQAKIYSDKSNYNALAFSNAENGQNEKALSYLKQALDLDPKDAYTYYNLGTIKWHSRDLKGALSDYNKALSLDPKNTDVYNTRGIFRKSLGDLKGALSDYNKALSVDPKYAKAYYNRGNVRQDLGDLKGALSDYNKALSVDPTYAKAYYNRGNVRQDLEDLKGALSDYNKALSVDPTYAKAYFNRGLVRDSLGDLKGALSDYNKALSVDPKNAIAYNNRGNVRDSLGDLKGALSDYNKALSVDPKYAKTYYNRGNVRQDLGDLKGALSDYNKALSLDPKDAYAYYNRGIVRQDLGDLKGALSDYNKVLSLDPKNTKAYNNRGNVRKSLGNLKGALSDYNKALSLDPKYAIAYNNRGIVRQSLGDDLKGALSDYNKALSFDPKLAIAYNNREIVRKKLRDLK